MNPMQESDRLSRIATQWTMLIDAHADNSGGANDSAQLVVHRYSGAVYRYLLGAVGDADVAEELCQEFLVRFLEGRLQRADPEKGRFRDYLKRVLINLVNDHYRRKSRRPQSLPADVAQAGPADNNEDRVDDCIRNELLKRTWEALAQAHPGYYRVLRMRVDSPSLSSSEMAAKLSRDTDKSLTAATVRKSLERARAKFGQLLVDEVARMASANSADELRQELDELDLLKYCRATLDEEEDGAA